MSLLLQTPLDWSGSGGDTDDTELGLDCWLKESGEPSSDWFRYWGWLTGAFPGCCIARRDSVLYDHKKKLPGLHSIKA
jgi:hypothetical protein